MKAFGYLARIFERYNMSNTLYIGFKGKNNTSCAAAEQFENHYLLTNSFDGLRKDIEAIDSVPGRVIMFGVDKSLTDSVRIERVAEVDGERSISSLDLIAIALALRDADLEVSISGRPTQYLCNDAYLRLLKKFDGRAVLIQIPTIKNADENFIKKLIILKSAYLE